MLTKKTLVSVLAFSFLPAVSASQTIDHCVALGSAVPETPLENVLQPVVLVLVDFPDGRLPDGSLPTQDADTALVANIDAVGSMGYTDPRTTCRKMIRKYVYEDYWNMFFSTNTYSGPGIHPDYSTHNGYTPAQQAPGEVEQIFDLTVYGSVRDYWAEVSYGNFQIEASQTHSGPTDMYHTGIVNNVIAANGKNYVSWIMIRSNKPAYHVADSTLRSDIYAKLDQLHALPKSDPGYIEFDRSTFAGKIGIITAGGQLGGWAYLGGTEFFACEKLWNGTNVSCSCILNGITELAHEFGHTIGFEHMAVGSYDIMHWGGFSDRRYYFCPPHINPLAKLKRHWLDAAYNVVGITSSGAFSIAPITSGEPQVAIATIYGDPGRDGDWNHSEYYLIEYRKREKFNRFAGGPDHQGFGGGALIWHYSRYGTCRSAFTAADQSASGIDFSLALMVSGYGSGYKSNSGDPSDLFYPGHSTLDATSTPNSNSMNNYATGISLNNFLSGSALTFNAAYSQGSIPPYTYFFRYGDEFPSDGSFPSGAVYVEGYRNTNTLIIGNGVSVDFGPQGGCGLMTVNSSAACFRIYEAGSVRLYKSWYQSVPLAVSGGTTVMFTPGSQLVLGTNSTLTTSSGTSLNFEPGSAVRSGSGSSLIVSGTLSANGNSLLPITFDRIGSSRTWGGILFRPNSQGTLSYCKISNATYGVYAGFGGNGDDQYPAPAVQNCTIDNNMIGLYFDGLGNFSSPIQNDTISNNSSHGIYLYNSWPRSISGNTISSNGGDGISLSNSGGGIAGNTISGNGMNGIYCYNRSIPSIWDNIILANRGAGVKCDYYSPATLLAAPSGNGRNVIRRNYVSVGADYSSNMIAGYSYDDGLNSMYEEGMVNVEAGNHSHVEAERNYWGDTPTPSTDIYSGGTLDCGNALIDDPNAGTVNISASIGHVTREPQNHITGTGASFANNSFLDLHLVAMLHAMLDGNCAAAIPQYSQRYEVEKDSAKKQYILTQLGECYLNTPTSDFVGFLNSAVLPGLSHDDPLYATTLELENFFFIRDGRYDEAIVNFETLAGRFARDTSAVKHALFGLWSLYAQGLKDTENAKEYLQQLKTGFPTDDLTWHARLLSGETESISGPGKSMAVLPGRTELLANFPNPFNLSTTIRYGLPQRSPVTLVIYNILGQQVAVLVNGEQEAGYYDVKFDGTNCASGLYFYRLIAGDFVQTRKLLLLK